MPSPEPIRRAAAVAHGERGLAAIPRLEAAASAAGVELVDDDGAAELAVVLGGDGTILRALQRFLGAGVPVIGVNFGRVGFLSSIEPDRMEEGLARAFAGDFRVISLPTLELDVDGTRAVAVNDIVCASSIVGRMIELSWAVGGEDMGVLPCDGIICATPPGSTAYNLSSGGPVLVWGLEAMAVTFVSPHSLHARPLVVPPGIELCIRNRTPAVPVTVIADGIAVAELRPEGTATARLGEGRSLLATLPEVTFLHRFSETFAS